jgi:hypothetical protein
VAFSSGPARATTVTTEAGFRFAWQSAAETQITLEADISFTNCAAGSADRNSATALTVTGNGHTITQTCPDNVLRQGGNGGLTFDGITITGGTSAPGIAGGGLLDIGTGAVTFTNSTVSGNHAGESGGGIGANGPVTLTNSTVSGNSGTEGGGISAGTAGISAGTVTLVYATVVGNSAASGANITHVDTLVPFGSVIAAPQGGANCVVDVTTSNGFNFSDDASCELSGTGDRQNAGDPGLGALANNGGPTQTRLPQTGSPLIDAIPIGSCQGDGASGITTDQRGVIRPQGAGCDIGAVEVVPAALSPPTSAAPSAAALTPGAAVPIQGVARFTG